MGFLAPLIFAAVLLGFSALFSQESRVASINPTQAQLQSNGQSFVAYRNAVMTYQQNNPTFTGSVPVGVLGNGFSNTFLGQVGNIVVPTGARNGRVVLCYGNFPRSIAAQAAIATNNDVSFGISNGTTWTSAAVGAPPVAMPLPTTIPSGYVVSVIQLDL